MTLSEDGKTERREDGKTVWVGLGCNAMPLHDSDAIRGLSDYLGILIPRPGLQAPSGQRLPA